MVAYVGKGSITLANLQYVPIDLGRVRRGREDTPSGYHLTVRSMCSSRSGSRRRAPNLVFVVPSVRKEFSPSFYPLAIPQTSPLSGGMGSAEGEDARPEQCPVRTAALLPWVSGLPEFELESDHIR